MSDGEKALKETTERAVDKLLSELVEMDITLEQLVDTIDYAKDYARNQAKQFKIKK